MNPQIERNGTSSVNPATGETFAFHPFVPDGDLKELLADSHTRFIAWRATPLAERLEILRRFADGLRTERDALAREATLEMGKTIASAGGEIDKCAAVIDWYVERAPQLLADRPVPVPSGKAHLAYEPLGVVLGVMPWNFPYWQILRAAVPITTGGNFFLVKPAENTMGCGALLQKLAEKTGFSRAFAVANLTKEQCATALADTRIVGVSVTGSVRAGQALAQLAGRNIKKSVLELGGADPFIVLADADLDVTVKAAVSSRFSNCGQVCIAAKRIIVEDSVRDRFTRDFVAAVKDLEPRDPMDEGCFIGPMARIDLRDTLHRQVEHALSEGATLLAGGFPLNRPGAWYQPTVLGNITQGMTPFTDELFGPVASIISARNADHAIELANDSRYGLCASLWTRDEDQATRLARRIEAGGVFINRISASDPHLPIGGIKESGFGRELTEWGLYEFMNVKTVWHA
ncbi:NAD-dependent succinate-semialdehyde dehydrogenase [Brytella acorum]|uniref:NAD-dependent succinate-semialdehyde dehydrogenase n=1 Tax=Brytella acorum TaxID=2959299 RepID=A0AA35Y3D3_9PROT|nr:NAD-dependent succinate-semialdehyde dehydrogenase [Brytella acorum]MDF3623821.1 NAD-dependent succinate-semialdehyde dehydrogenase [Brytella acorum]CAI9120736.1 NAD-dependent succinate-semialdehyde dehydrogenase [Brytella acorum]